MNIIGFSGQKQAGKSTSAQWVLDHYDAVQYDFAAPLKEIILSCFDIELRHLYGTDADKNEIQSCGLSGRELMQRIGTDWFRAIDPNCWLQAWKKKISDHTMPQSLLVVADTRFPNEVQAIQLMGGRVIRLTRHTVYGCSNEHSSETALTDYRFFDWFIHNQNITLKERNVKLKRYFDHYLSQVMELHLKE